VGRSTGVNEVISGSIVCLRCARISLSAVGFTGTRLGKTQPAPDLVGSQRSGKMVALRDVAAVTGKKGKLCFVLDAFGNHRHAHAVRQGDRAAYEAIVPRTIAASSLFCAIPATKLRSIFSSEIGKRFRQESDE